MTHARSRSQIFVNEVGLRERTFEAVSFAMQRSFLGR